LDIVPLFGLLGRGVLPILRLKPFTLSLSLSALAGDTLLPGDLLVKEHVISVPVDHGTGPNGRFGSLEVFLREIVPASKSTNADMPCLMYLQGGPGFPSSRPQHLLHPKLMRHVHLLTHPLPPAIHLLPTALPPWASLPSERQDARIA
jgi:hypothetical protein